VALRPSFARGLPFQPLLILTMHCFFSEVKRGRRESLDGHLALAAEMDLRHVWVCTERAREDETKNAMKKGPFTTRAFVTSSQELVLVDRDLVSAHGFALRPHRR
jgi:hypothetical protein